ncbi:MAG: hypothetical protein ACMG50_04390 [Thermomonas sp.]
MSIALLFAGGYAAAAESQHPSADGSASCPDSVTTTNDRNELGDTDPATALVAPLRHSEKAKTLVTPRSNSGNRASAPRWHSFLPGMFR